MYQKLQQNNRIVAADLLISIAVSIFYRILIQRHRAGTIPVQQDHVCDVHLPVQVDVAVDRRKRLR